MWNIRQDVTIAGGLATGLSGPADLGEGRLRAIVMPATWTSAALTFQGSVDGLTYQDIMDETGAELSVTVGAGKSTNVYAPDFVMWRFLKVRSGSSGSATTQGAASPADDRVITLLATP